METESWLPVPDYEDYYEVSDHGQVRSFDRRTWNGVKWFMRPGRILKATLSGKGYRKVGLHKESGSKASQRNLHVLVLETFVGPRPEGMVVRHLNGDPADNRITNLAWGTPTQNSQDMLDHGRNKKAAQTHCNYGHVLLNPNLAQHKTAQGHRKCKACNRGRGYMRWHPELDMQTESDRYYTTIMSVES